MKITRENYANFMFKAVPLLTLAYFIQAYFYLTYGPPGLAQEVVVFMGVSLVGVFIYYFLYDYFYKVVFHPTYLEVTFDPIHIRRECIYREIMDVEIKNQNKSYQNVLIHLRNGKMVKLSHVDNADIIRKYLLERS